MEKFKEFEKLFGTTAGSFSFDEVTASKRHMHSISDKIRSSIRGKGYRFDFEPDVYWATGSAASPFVDVSDELEEVKVKVDNLSNNMDGLRSEVLSCKDCIDRLSEELSGRPLIKGTWLVDIGEGIEVLQPIPIVIEETKEEVIASFPEIEAFGVGVGEAEAIGDLKEEIRKLFFELENISEDELGKLPISWKRVLLKVVKNIGNAQ